ncbi:S53 family peptidase [Lentilactobacillus kisonensis]|uniref:Pro-kumamolisin, activation domain protein n=1 Tax=Lentilactobacillus kisonensis F0435 TaxID=797516 RepID=H1LHZ0_9LACO|nr:S53 family peptidase [Lentilactobacillus kisonensis]EHO50025.1 Pro-kumamolisin, activation domain protein [Lentilactobacillus kisonensis F0435]
MKNAKRWLVGLISFAVLLAMAPSTQAATKQKTAGSDPYGINKILKQLTQKKKVSPNKYVYLDVVLKPRNEGQLSDKVYAVNTPGNSEFKQFYTPAKFQSEFGQPAPVVGQYKPFFKKYHLKSQSFSNGLIIKVSGKVKNVNKAFSTNIQSAKYHSNPVQFSKKKPVMPAKLANNVLTVLGITTIKQGLGALAKKQGDSSKVKAKYAPSKFAKHYQLQSLYGKGYEGQGQTLGIISFADVNKRDPEHFWNSEKINTKSNRISVKKIGSPTSLATNDAIGKLETTFDIEQSGAIAPQANIRVYQANFSDVGLVNAYSTAFEENRASSLSMSWGLSEYLTHYLKTQRLLTPVYGQVLNTVMAQGALQGISTFVSSGDTGAYNRGIGAKLGPISLPNYSTYGTFPADNPWVTATGGTTLPFSKKLGDGINISVDKERAWGGDYMFKAFAKNRKLFLSNVSAYQAMLAGGGGGISHLYGTPQYQQGVPGVNTFNARSYISNLMQPRMNPVLVSGTDYGRNFPDVSANADPMTGYQVYSGGKWLVMGGTSAVAPQFNGATAVINSGKGSRMGFWNPQIYQLAQDKDKTPFTVLDSDSNNSNLYYVGQPGKIYNQATGLGTVNFEKLFDEYQ